MVPLALTYSYLTSIRLSVGTFIVRDYISLWDSYAGCARKTRVKMLKSPGHDGYSPGLLLLPGITAV